MAGGNVNIEMSPELRRFFEQAPEQFKQAAARALYAEAELIMADSKENYCPVDVGNLRDTGHVKQPKIDGGQVIVEMGYGGPAVDYAEIVHERLDVHHPVGQAKYLETPLNQAKSGLLAKLAERIKRDMGL